MKLDAQLNVYNFAKMRAEPVREFEYLRFDSNNDCNVHCVYCHNTRSKELIDDESLDAFLANNVASVEHFQFGCIMEPTLDPRLSELMLKVAASRAKPTASMFLQTNGILLHRHDLEKMRQAGLSRVSVSIDSASVATHKLLRGGTSLGKVFTNLEGFAKSFPDCEITFITTVCRANIHEMELLVARGLEIGVSRFVLREMFYVPESDVVDHSRMPDLILPEGEFARMRDAVTARFGQVTALEFADVPALDRHSRLMSKQSLRE